MTASFPAITTPGRKPDLIFRLTFVGAHVVRLPPILFQSEAELQQALRHLNGAMPVRIELIAAHPIDVTRSYTSE